jgi:hypothetical protein
MKSQKTRFAVLGAVMLLIAACARQEPPAAPADPLPLGHYRATLTLPGG